MSRQAVNTQAIVTTRQRDGSDEVTRLYGELIVAVRVDSPPTKEADRLAAAGNFYPLTSDADGHLRVVLRSDTSVQTEELEVLREIRDLLIESRDLLLKIA